MLNAGGSSHDVQSTSNDKDTLMSAVGISDDFDSIEGYDNMSARRKKRLNKRADKKAKKAEKLREKAGSDESQAAPSGGGAAPEQQAGDQQQAPEQQVSQDDSQQSQESDSADGVWATDVKSSKPAKKATVAKKKSADGVFSADGDPQKPWYKKPLYIGGGLIVLAGAGFGIFKAIKGKK